MKKLMLVLNFVLIASMILAGCAQATPTTVVAPPVEAPATAAPVAEYPAQEAPLAEYPAQEAPMPAPPAYPAVGVTEPAAPAGPKILKVRITADIQDMDPAFMTGSLENSITNNIYQGLIEYRGNYDQYFDALISEPLKVSEDGLKISFKLREGIQFQKGYGELTAEDVKYSFERIINPDLDASYRDNWKTLDHVEVTGKYTGDIILNEPFAPLFSSTLPATTGWIVSKKAVEDIGDEKLKTNPIGTGPYEFVEWVPNQKVVLKRYDGYWGPKAYWDEIDFLVIVENSAAEIALEAGEIDFTLLGTDSVDRLSADPKYTIYPIGLQSYGWIAMNVQYPTLKDVNVRKAIREAIDVPSILEAAYNGKYQQACAMIAPGMIGYWADAPCYPRNVEKAKEYMKAAGIDSLDVTLTYENGAEAQTTAEIVQANLAEIGITVELVPQDGGVFWEEGYGENAAKVRQLTIMSYSTYPDPSFDTQWFTCVQVVEWNWMYWCNPEFDKLNDEGMKVLDPEKRKEIYIQAQKLMDQDAIAVWLYFPTNYYASRSSLDANYIDSGNAYYPWMFREK
jgi:peptide/nickel transport system substrate-binding protein